MSHRYLVLVQFDSEKELDNPAADVEHCVDIAREKVDYVHCNNAVDVTQLPSGTTIGVLERMLVK